jgi:hypothetical protein
LIIFNKATVKLDESGITAMAPVLDMLMTFINPVIYASILISKPEKWK